MSIDIETVKLLINVATFSMTKKIEAIETKFQTKFNEQESNHKMEIGRLETQIETLFEMVEKLTEDKSRNEMSREDSCQNTLTTKVYQQDAIINNIIKTQQNVIEKTIYYDNAIDRLGNQKFNSYTSCSGWPELSYKINSKAMDLTSFIDNYSLQYCHKVIATGNPLNEVNDPFGGHPGIPIYCVSPILLLSLNVFYNLKILMYSEFPENGNLYINAFTNDKMISQNYYYSGSTINVVHHFNYKLTPLFTVETLYLPLSTFKVWDKNVLKETYTNFFKNTFPNLKTIYISVSDKCKMIEGHIINGCRSYSSNNYSKDTFLKCSIEYGLNYMIEHTNIEKIIFINYVFTNYYSDNIKVPELPNDICEYLKNIVTKNKTRQIILEIKNSITAEELKNSIVNLK